MHCLVSCCLHCLQEVKSVPEPWTLKDEPGSTHIMLERKYEDEKVVVDLLIHEQVRPELGGWRCNNLPNASCTTQAAGMVVCRRSSLQRWLSGPQGSEPGTQCHCEGLCDCYGCCV